MKKMIVKLDLNDDKDKQKAMKSVSTLHGIDSIAMDMKEKKMTVIGTVDPIDVVSKLRKTWHADIVAVGPAKEEKKDGKKDDKKDGKNEEKKEEKKDDKKKEEKKEKEKEKEPHQQMQMMHDFVYAYNRGYPQPYPQPHQQQQQQQQQYFVRSMEENPNACVIC